MCALFPVWLLAAVLVSLEPIEGTLVQVRASIRQLVSNVVSRQYNGKNDRWLMDEEDAVQWVLHRTYISRGWEGDHPAVQIEKSRD